jgi:hypothetical protein
VKISGKTIERFDGVGVVLIITGDGAACYYDTCGARLLTGALARSAIDGAGSAFRIGHISLEACIAGRLFGIGDEMAIEPGAVVEANPALERQGRECLNTDLLIRACIHW